MHDPDSMRLKAGMACAHLMGTQPPVVDTRVALVSVRVAPVAVLETSTDPLSVRTRRAPSLEAKNRVYVAEGKGSKMKPVNCGVGKWEAALSCPDPEAALGERETATDGSHEAPPSHATSCESSHLHRPVAGVLSSEGQAGGHGGAVHCGLGPVKCQGQQGVISGKAGIRVTAVGPQSQAPATREGRALWLVGWCVWRCLLAGMCVAPQGMSIDQPTG